MKKILVSLFLALAFFFSLLFPAQSETLSLSWPVEGQLGVKFGEKYQAQDGEKTHLGVDILVPEGTEIKSPATGEVSFAGQVAGRLAVTLIVEGYKVSLSPLQEISVFRGDKVEAGQAVGKLAAEGDYSLSQPHLHLSLRDSTGQYLDPLPFLPPLKAEEQPQTQPQEQPVSNEVGVTPESGGEPVENSILNQSPAQNEANQLQRETQTRNFAWQPGLTSQKVSQMWSLEDKSVLQKRGLEGKLEAEGLKREVKSLSSITVVEPKKENLLSFNRINQSQPKSLSELTELSVWRQQRPNAQLNKDGVAFNLSGLLLLGWSFLVLPFIYFLLFQSEEGYLKFRFRLAGVSC